MPALRLAVDLAFLLILLFGMMGVGRLILKFTFPMEQPGSFFLAIGLGLLVYFLGVFALGAANQLTAAHVLILTGAMVFLSAWVHVRNPHDRPASTMPGETWTFFEKVLFGLTGLFLIAHLLFAYAPPAADDELFYQLSLPASWAMNGSLKPFLDNYTTYLPQNAQLLYAAIFAVRGVLAVKAMVWLTSCLVLSGLWFFSRRQLRLSRRVCLLVALFFVSMPFTTSLSGVTSSDLMNIYFEVCALSLLWESRARESLAVFALAGCFAGAGIGARVYAGAWVAAMVLALLVDKRFKGAAIMSACALAAVAPWLVRDAVLTGNPFYPNTFWKGAATDYYFVREKRAYAARLGNEFFNMPLLLTYGDTVFGMGAAITAFLPFALFSSRQSAVVKRLFLLAALTIAVYVAVFPWKGHARYNGGSFAFFAILAAIGFETFVELLPARWRRFVAAWLVIGFIAPRLAFSEYFGLTRLPFLTGRQSADAYLEKHFDYCEGYPMVEFIRSKIGPAGDILSLTATFPMRYYYLPQVILHGLYEFRPDFYRCTARELASRLSSKHIRYVLLSKQVFTPEADGGWTLNDYARIFDPFHVPKLVEPSFTLYHETPLALLYEVHSGG